MSDDPRVLQFRRGSVPPSERAPWQSHETPPQGHPALDEGEGFDGSVESADLETASPSLSEGAARSDDAALSDEAPDSVAPPTFGSMDRPDVAAPTLLRRRAKNRGADEVSSVVPFRRRSRERRVRRLRRHPLVRWSVPALLAVLIVGIPVATFFWFAHSPRFALGYHEVSYEGAHRVENAWVDRALQPFYGENLWLLPLDEVKTSLLRHPWIADVGLRKRPPNDLILEVVERQERALVASEGRLFFVDAEGRRIVPLEGPWRRPGTDLPILSGGNGSETSIAAAVEMLDEIEAVAPSWSAGLSEIEILSERDFRVHTVDLPFPLLVRKSTLEHRARRLQQLLPSILERYDAVAAVDLRFVRRIIIEPAGREAFRSRASA